MRSIIASILGLLVCLFAGNDLERLRLPIICVFAYLGLDAVFYAAEMARRSVNGDDEREAALAQTKPASGQSSVKSSGRSEVCSEANSGVLGLMSQLQQRARLVDFAMEDITSYTDAQVGAAARVVHQGCRGVLNECFSLSAIDNRQEGANVSVRKGFDSHQLRLIGAAAEREEYAGRLVHKGWKTARVSVPKLIDAPVSGEIVIQPAEVEVVS